MSGEAERPAVEVVIRGFAGAGRSTVAGLIYDALRSKGINVDCFEGGYTLADQVIPVRKEPPGGKFDGRRVVVVAEGCSLTRKFPKRRGMMLGRRAW